MDAENIREGASRMLKKTVIYVATIVFSASIFAAESVPAGDQTFAKAAAQGGMAEVKIGQLAASKGQDPKVKNFGERMADDHAKAEDELAAIMNKKGISVPSELNAKDNALMTKLAHLSGIDFDKTYMTAMVKDHETDVAEFQKEAENGKDADIKGFASKTISTLQEHLRMAKETASTVGAK
jgi:putative membrane protein